MGQPVWRKCVFCKVTSKDASSWVLTHGSSFVGQLFCRGKSIDHFLSVHRWWGGRKRCRRCWWIAQVTLLQESGPTQCQWIMLQTHLSLLNPFPLSKVSRSHLVRQLGVIVRHSIEWGTAKSTRQEILSIQLATAIGSKMGKVDPNQWLHEGQQGKLLEKTEPR